MKYLIGIFLLSQLNACTSYYYTFNGVTTNAKSIYIQNFTNISAQGPSNIGQTFTEKLKEYYLQNSRIKLENVENEADIMLKGNIIGYITTPIAATGDSRAAQTRLTITVNVEFIDNKDDKKNFKQPFSFYKDFNQTQTLSSVENELIDGIFTQIALDIFNKTVADW